MSFLVVAFPEWEKEELERIQRFRAQHDALYFQVVDPHFTLIFPVSGYTEEAFVAAIKERVHGLTQIPFVLRSAILNKDAFKPYYHAFLVPEEGYSDIVKMHDQLYGGKLAGEWRTDIDYIPHIGVGNAGDELRCKEMVEAWNVEAFAIAGRIRQLTLLKYEANVLTRLVELELPPEK